MLFLLTLLTVIPLFLKEWHCYGKRSQTGITMWKIEFDNMTGTLDYVESYKSRRGVTNMGLPIPLSDEEKLEIVNVHNKYRSQVFPPAANMRYMEWNEEIAHSAQTWANKCIFKHGRPSVSRFKGAVGQNIYKGSSASLSFYMSLWYDEVQDFDMRLKRCNGSKCGHYIQIVWAESFLIGCGHTKCEGVRGPFNIFVCHYHKPFENYDPYTIGMPCSMCNTEIGGFCYNNMCVSKEDCEKKNWLCECNLKCHNCGVLNKSTCSCKCPPGWDFQDCSEQCVDEDSWCGKEGGYEGWVGCQMLEDNSVRDRYCRKMCKSCEDITKDNEQTTCCEGKGCESGYVLNLVNNNCSCQLLCPGPECHTMPNTTASDSGHRLHRRNYILLTLVILLVYYDLCIVVQFR